MSQGQESSGFLSIVTMCWNAILSMLRTDRPRQTLFAYCNVLSISALLQQAGGAESLDKY